MSKPLTIDELKALPVGDWVWIKSLLEWDDYYKTGRYVEIDCIDEDNLCFVADCRDWEYRDYGKTWLAYKNKEQAEAKGEYLELPCIAMIEQGLVDGKMKQSQEAQGFNGRYSVVYMDKTKCKIPLIDVCWSKEGKCRYAEAERRLAELRGEK